MSTGSPSWSTMLRAIVPTLSTVTSRYFTVAAFSTILKHGSTIKRVLRVIVFTVFVRDLKQYYTLLYGVRLDNFDRRVGGV